MKELHAKVTEVRPDRPLFVRKLQIGTQRPQLQIVALHGTCATEAQFQRVWDALEVRSNRMDALIVAYDSFGLAQSPVVSTNAKDYTNAELQLDLLAVVDQFVDDSLPLFIMGHSYGPTHIYATMEKLKCPIRGLILIGTAVKSKHLPIADGGHPIMKLPIFILNCLQGVLTESFIKLSVHPNNHWLADNLRNENNANDMRVAKAYHNQMMWYSMDSTALIIPKTLIVHGAEDKIIPVECGQHLHNKIPNSKLMIVDCASHLVHMEHASKIAEAIESFIVDAAQ